MHRQWINLLVLSKVWSVYETKLPKSRNSIRPSFPSYWPSPSGNTLGEAMSESALDEAGLRNALHFIFTDGLVSSLAPRA